MFSFGRLKKTALVVLCGKSCINGHITHDSTDEEVINYYKFVVVRCVLKQAGHLHDDMMDSFHGWMDGFNCH